MKSIRRYGWLGATLVGLALLVSCEGDRSVKDKQASAVTASPVLLEVKDKSKQLLFLYRDGTGTEQRALSIDEIPDESRARVQVVDLSRSPSERRSKDYVQLFDLRKATAQGTYPGRVIPRQELEAALADEQALPVQPSIVLYSTSWCGVCKKARRFLKEQGLAFIEHDIEQNRAAARELQEKSKRAGIPLGGVPVIDVGGALMRGFDPQRLMSVLKQP